jgi:hypothetical protein
MDMAPSDEYDRVLAENVHTVDWKNSARCRHCKLQIVGRNRQCATGGLPGDAAVSHVAAAQLGWIDPREQIPEPCDDA